MKAMAGTPIRSRRRRACYPSRSQLFLVWMIVLAPQQGFGATDEAIEGTCRDEDGGSCAADTRTYFDLVSEPHFGKVTCSDKHKSCDEWSKAGECMQNPVFMLDTCELSCRSCLYVTRRYGVQQAISIKSEAFLEEYMLTQSMHEYIVETVYKDESYESVRETCLNQEKDCVHWAVKGECINNPQFMLRECAPACKSCHIVEFNARCPNATTTTAKSLWTKAGDLNLFFDSLLSDAKDFSPTIYSMPSEYIEIVGSKPWVALASSAKELYDGPWVITLDNFFSVEECKHLIDQGHILGYERSTDVGSAKADGTFAKVKSRRRTSTNAWCSGDCFNDSVVQTMTKRLELLLRIPTNNTESWQLLRYEEGQEYKEHHDFVQQQVTRAEGPRILTVFFYLNNVTEGGGTQFPALNNLTIYPVEGRVLIWPSVLNENANEKDIRTNHRALPVEEGVKYGANAWVHLRDYKTPQSLFCI